jgi:hypothetical protein
MERREALEPDREPQAALPLAPARRPQDPLEANRRGAAVGAVQVEIECQPGQIARRGRIGVVAEQGEQRIPLRLRRVIGKVLLVLACDEGESLAVGSRSRDGAVHVFRSVHGTSI